MGFFDRVKSTFLHWIYPRRCAFCSAVISPKETICPDCVKKLAWVQAPICKTLRTRAALLQMPQALSVLPLCRSLLL